MLSTCFSFRSNLSSLYGTFNSAAWLNDDTKLLHKWIARLIVYYNCKSDGWDPNIINIAAPFRRLAEASNRCSCRPLLRLTMRCYLLQN